MGLGAVFALSGCSGGGLDIPMPSFDFGLNSAEEPKEAEGAAKPADIAGLMTPGPLPEQSLGKASAPVTVIEYCSLSNAQCAAFHNINFAQFKRAYIDTGKVLYIYRDVSTDQPAMVAAAATRCVPENAYYKAVEKLFARQSAWIAVSGKPDTLYNLVKETRVQRAAFDTCLANQNINDGLVWVKNKGMQFGVTSTPTFFVNGQKSGASVDELRSLIDPLLVNPSAKSTPQPSQGRSS